MWFNETYRRLWIYEANKKELGKRRCPQEVQDAKVEISLYSVEVLKLWAKMDQIATHCQEAERVASTERENITILTFKLKVTKAEFAIYKAREEQWWAT